MQFLHSSVIICCSQGKYWIWEATYPAHSHPPSESLKRLRMSFKSAEPSSIRQHCPRAVASLPLIVMPRNGDKNQAKKDQQPYNVSKAKDSSTTKSFTHCRHLLYPQANVCRDTVTTTSQLCTPGNPIEMITSGIGSVSDRCLTRLVLDPSALGNMELTQRPRWHFEADLGWYQMNRASAEGWRSRFLHMNCIVFAS